MVFNRTARVAAIVVASLVLGVGVAHAFWSSGGTGTGTGSAGNGTMTISAAAMAGETAHSALYPGGTADAIVKIDNPNG